MRLLFLLLILFTFFRVQAQTDSYGQQSPLLIENKGQIYNSDKTAATNVLFSMNTPGLDFYLTDQGVSYVFRQLTAGNDTFETSAQNPRLRSEIGDIKWHRVDVTPQGAHINRDKIDIVYSKAGKVMVYNPLTPDGVHMVPVESVTFRDIYPGIDWQFVVEDEFLKYNFILHPGADLAQIQLLFEGQSNLRLEENRLIVETSIGSLAENKIESFTSGGKQVDVSAVLNENILSYSAPSLPELNDDETLIIDPPLVWSTYYGGTLAERAVVMERNSNGFIYVLVESASNDFPVLSEGGMAHFQGVTGGGTDVCILKFTEDGIRVWSTYYGGTGNDYPANLFYNGTVLVVCGYTTSGDFPTFNPGLGAYFDNSLGGANDGFIIAFTIADVRTWATYFGGSVNGPSASARDEINDCTIKNGKLYITGHVTSADLPVVNPGTAYFDNTVALMDNFVAEFTGIFNLTWCTYMGGSNNDLYPYCDIDSLGRLMITYQTTSTDIPLVNTLPGSFSQPYIGGIEYGISLFDANRQLIWQTYMGGSADDWPNDVICDYDNRWLITGISKSGTTGTPFPVANNIGASFYQPVKGAPTALTADAVLIKMGSGGQQLYTSYYGGNLEDAGMGITLDSHENLYIVGYTRSTDLVTYNPLDGSYYDNTFNSLFTTTPDAFLFELDSNYTMKWATFMGARYEDVLLDVRVSPSDHVFAVGYTKSNSFPLFDLTPGVSYMDNTLNITNVDNGNRDAVIMKFIPCPENFNAVAGTDSVCYGLNDTLVSSGGYTYSWNNGVSNDTLIAPIVSDTSFIVTSTHAWGCVERDTFQIVVKPLPVISFAGDSMVCFEDSMHLSASGGVSYLWEGGSTNDSISFLPAASDILTVTVTNSYGCTTSDSIQTTVYALPVPVISGDDTPCLNDTTTLTASGGVSYVWSNAATTPTVDIGWSSTGIFDYWSIATDVNGCADTAFFTATVTNLPQFWLGNDTIICDLTSITLDPGIAGASYNWSTGAVTQNIPVNSANQYWLDLSDANSCHWADTINVAVQALPVITFGGSDTTCFGSSITMSASAPTGTSYLWSNGMSTSTITFTPTASGLDTISVTITDALTCSQTDSLEFMVYALPVPVIAGDNTPCLNDLTTLTASGGISYLWNTSATTSSISIPFNSMGTYNYWSIATDVHGCRDTAFFSATVLALPVFNLGPDTIICSGTSITLDPGIAGASYDWSTGATSQTIAVNSANTYTLEVTDGNTCQWTDAITVAVQALPVITFGGSDTTCLGSSITISASAPTGASYLWSNGMSTSTITFTPTASGLDTISVIVSDALTCASTDSLEFMVYALPVPAITGDLSPCQNDTTTLTVNGGVSYLWSNSTVGSTSDYVFGSAGNNTVYSIATDIHGCSDTAFFTAGVHALPVFDLGPDTTICINTTITLDPSLVGMTYDWNTGAVTQTIDVNTIGVYSLEVIDGNACHFTDSISVFVQPFPLIMFGGDTAVCFESPINITASGGSTYVWSNGMSGDSIVFVPTVSDTLTVVVTDIFGCSSTDSTWFDVFPLPVPAISGSNELCQNDTTTLTASGGLSYEWSTSATAAIVDVTPGTSGMQTYYVIATDLNGCSDTAFHQIDVHPLPVFELGADTTLCTGNSLTLDAQNAGSVFSWSSGEATQTISVSLADEYWALVTDANSCQYADTITVSVIPYADATIIDVSFICLNGAPFNCLAAQAGGSWSGSGIVDGVAGTFDPVTAGEGNTLVVYTISGQCGDSDSSTIEVGALPEINFTATDESCPDLNDGSLILDISGGVAPYVFVLDTMIISDTTLNLSPATYGLSVTDIRGCTSTGDVTILAETEPCGVVDFYIPNIFSPNGDLDNDLLLVRSDFISEMHWIIYDRFGEKVFETRSQDQGWDGEYQGQPVVEGVYFWFIKVTFIDDSTLEREGNVTVVR